MAAQSAASHRRSQSKFQASEKQKKIRASRNWARRQLEKEGIVHKGDGKDVDHANSNPLDRRRGNLRVRGRRANRKDNKRG